jgi:hypothetical protein
MTDERAEPSREQRVDEAIAASLEAVDNDSPFDREAFPARDPDLAAELSSYFADHDEVNQLADPLRFAHRGQLTSPRRRPALAKNDRANRSRVAPGANRLRAFMRRVAMRKTLMFLMLLGWLGGVPVVRSAEPLPFKHKVEVYRPKEGEIMAFSVRLEQPFLAEEFEKSNYLRLQALDRNAYLIYPKETKFQQKHAEFYGRLRGEGKARLRLAYEIVSENPNGSRKVEVRQGDVEVTIPTAETGPQSIYREWAQQQNAHFLHLLHHYPHESFFQYVLLQSRDRYGVMPPDMSTILPAESELESNLYDVFTGSLAVQESLQRLTLRGGPTTGDLNSHISQLSPPAVQSLPYAELLEKARQKGVQPRVSEIAKLVPADQYFVHFQSMTAASDLFDMTTAWGDDLLRLAVVHARDNRIRQKFEDQLCIRREPLTRLFADRVVAEFAVTGSDPFVQEGTDVTILFRLKQPEVFEKAAAGWLAQVKEKRKDIEEREFNYRGQKVAAHYTPDRTVSSFVVRLGDYAVFSNSHRAIRKIMDSFLGLAPRLQDALDYRYVSTLLPPSDQPQSGYVYASEAFLRRMISPAVKISEKRRVQCFNNLVMLNNASLFYRLEYGRSPTSLTDLIEGRFVDPRRLVCPHGGAYAFDAPHDACTCSLHNRLKYLTPNVELTTLQVSEQERQEYERYKQSYQQFWQGIFDPIAVRITVAPRVKLEVCVLPFANGSLYTDLRQRLDDKPQPIPTARIASSAVASVGAVVGRRQIAGFLRALPGVAEVLEADPTLTDLSWVGDQLSMHLCDDGTVVEIDPMRLRPLDQLPGKATVMQQGIVALGVLATKLPVYITVDVEDRDKAARLLEQLSARIFLKRGDFFGLPTSLDAYRLPNYKGHALYVLSYQLYAVKVRLHVALVGSQLVAATKPQPLREVIDAASAKEARPSAEAHLLLRLNQRALKRLRENIQLYWEEKSRLACHRNIMTIDTLARLYEVPVEEVKRLSEAKYGVVYYCPDRGDYGWDTRRDQVVCSVHGNRQQSRQHAGPDGKSSFTTFMEDIDEVVASLRFQEGALITTVEIARRQPPVTTKPAH